MLAFWELTRKRRYIRVEEHVMYSMSMTASAALLAATTAVCVGAAPPARASNPAHSGTYTATAVGDWARTNTVLHVEQTLRSTWTITSSCTTAQDCSGQ